ncbi:MAG: hypothetical protein ABIO47_06870 [Sphingomicrobium sp.]
MGPGESITALVAIVVPAILLLYVFRRWFSLREKQLEVQARLTAEKAAEYATNNSALEQRVRVLEQIVTDRGAETAAQIEALRTTPRLTDVA